MKVDEKFEEKLDDFSNIVQDEFNFLVDEYGCKKKELERLNFEYVKDKQVMIEYLNDFVCVRVDWYLIDASMGVGLIKLENGKMPSRYSYLEKEGRLPAINLSTLVEVLTNGELNDPLPHFGPKAGGRKIMKARREREKLINESMREVLATYANWLKDYANDILMGDTSIFERVQKYYTEKITESYYG